MTTRTWLSIEEFLAGDWPAGTQLVDGEVIMNDPTFRHQRLAGRLFAALFDWTRGGPRRGEVGWGGNWTLAPNQVYKPDVWWAAEGSGPGNGVRSDSPPTLAVEVRSPGTWHIDTGRKMEVYEGTGVAELWLVDGSEHTVLVCRRSAPGCPHFDVTMHLRPGDPLYSPLLEGFELSLHELFAP